jgi:hypothetical protein
VPARAADFAPDAVPDAFSDTAPDALAAPDALPDAFSEALADAAVPAREAFLLICPGPLPGTEGVSILIPSIRGISLCE